MSFAPRNTCVWFLLRYTQNADLDRYQEVTIYDTGDAIDLAETIGASPLKVIAGRTSTMRSEFDEVLDPAMNKVSLKLVFTRKQALARLSVEGFNLSIT